MSVSSTRSGRVMPVQVQHEQYQARAKWTTPLTKALVDLMVEQITCQRNGQKLSVGNKWKYICDEFFARTGLRWDREQLKYRCSVLKKQYATVKSLLARSEFSWDETTGAIKGSDEVWDAYLKEHPDAETVRTSGCPIYKQMCILFSETGGTENSSVLGEKEGGPGPVSNVTEDGSTGSEEVADAATEHVKSQCTDSSTVVVNRKRGRKGVEDTMANAIIEMANASRMRSEAHEPCNQKYSIAKCINALDLLPDIDEKVYFAALELFNNPIAREVFLSLKVDKRLMWLQGKCKLPSSS